MRKKSAVVVAAFIAAALSGTTACGDGLTFVPQACLLASQNKVRSATGNPHLQVRGDHDTAFDGSICVFKDSTDSTVEWKFADEPAISGSSRNKLEASLRKQYDLHGPTPAQAKSGAFEHTKILTEKGGIGVRGALTAYADITLVVYAPKGATLKQVLALRSAVWDGYSEQAAAAIAGQ